MQNWRKVQSINWNSNVNEKKTIVYGTLWKAILIFVESRWVRERVRAPVHKQLFLCSSLIYSILFLINSALHWKLN